MKSTQSAQSAQSKSKNTTTQKNFKQGEWLIRIWDGGDIDIVRYKKSVSRDQFSHNAKQFYRIQNGKVVYRGKRDDNPDLPFFDSRLAIQLRRMTNDEFFKYARIILNALK